MRSVVHTAAEGLISRRRFVGLAAAIVALQACSKGPGKADEAFLASGGGGKTVDHDAWDKFLAAYVRPQKSGINLVAYSAVSDGDRDSLRSYLDRLQKVAVKDLGRDEQFAFWVNLYNAATVNLILEEYPVASIRDLGLLGQGPWGDKILTVEGKDLSLDDIEHTVLRPIWKDVRIHYAVNCASMGCPNLATRAYRASLKDEMLNAGAKAYINSPRGFRLGDDGLVASSIYDWYQVDWGSPEKVLEHARSFAAGKTVDLLKGRTTIDSYDYDWSLNEVV
ncbi:DUF547 domain-containing protein [Novosphingobium beihaiensis]|uniref:DUF547 domain-containing protein n=1 Tax=Novosphingobium beihaiensis TaxID=2930389 RepID=A0ABT0BL69_9SPHN|nr:DUF547 domain-containing protein [Novosphingobium beihaiensis]MCJ2185815.1 DUF547 domain-containing protein [Novosphingobium beihaiensis]